MKTYMLIFGLLSMLCLASADVGLVVEFPNGSIHSECIGISDGKSAYQILGDADISVDWTDDGPWGRGLCMINVVGSEPIGTTCANWDSYWAFSLALDKDEDWTTHSPVGSTAGGCWNRDYKTPSYDGHYCAQDGDVLGYHYTNKFPSGFPEFLSFEQICGEVEEKGPLHKRILMSSRPFWKEYCERCGIEYTDIIPPQNLVQRCKAKQATEQNTSIENQTANMINQTGSDVFSSNLTLQWDYEPKIITDLKQPFELHFFTESGPIFGLVVNVDGDEVITDKDGKISFAIGNHDYLVEFSDQVFGNFKKIFRFVT